VGVLPNSLLIVTDCSADTIRVTKVMMSNLTRNEEIMYALADAMAKLLGEEDDWSATASWLRDRALDDGFDLQMSFRLALRLLKIEAPSRL
jgi:hypothetical protein